MFDLLALVIAGVVGLHCLTMVIIAIAGLIISYLDGR